MGVGEVGVGDRVGRTRVGRVRESSPERAIPNLPTLVLCLMRQTPHNQSIKHPDQLPDTTLPNQHTQPTNRNIDHQPLPPVTGWLHPERSRREPPGRRVLSEGCVGGTLSFRIESRLRPTSNRVSLRSGAATLSGGADGRWQSIRLARVERCSKW